MFLKFSCFPEYILNILCILRYLPSSIVEQEERIKLLNEHSNEEEDASKEDYSGSAEYYQDNSGEVINNTSKEETSKEHTKTEEQDTTVPTSTKARTSTESLIDKLDRVQSDLSSGLLTGTNLINYW